MPQTELGQGTPGPGVGQHPGAPGPAATTLGEVAAWVGASSGSGTGAAAGSPGTAVTGITLASDRVVPGDLFAALPGHASHGAAHAGAAVGAGAVAVLTDVDGAAVAGAAGVPVLVVPDVRAVVGELAARLAGYPARELGVFAVTGTSGKTTTTYLLEAGLRGAGRHPGVIGTTGTRIDGRAVASALTTPEAPDLHRLLRRMVAEGADSVALEVSSHALVLHRVDGLVADVAAFTNLGRDHLDFHADMADYLAAKLRLFTPERARRAVVCVDDGPSGYGARVAAAARAAGLPTVTVAGRPGVEGAADADWAVTAVAPDGRGGTAFTVRDPSGEPVAGRVALPGAFNVSNAVLALACLVAGGVPREGAVDGIGSLSGVPGRLERVPGGPGAPVAYVDYAHKPEALEAVLTELRGVAAPGGRLGVVLGAGGERDRGKRPLMGAVASRLADLLVVTDDNPRGEEPAGIRAAILAGVLPGPCRVLQVGDRRAAIDAAVAELGVGDVLLVAGTGSESGQYTATGTVPFDDRVQAAQALAARSSGAGPAGAARPVPPRVGRA